jgi:4-amino-4-deoxy-L-arabinose transferase-like glycosyltransferase
MPTTSGPTASGSAAGWGAAVVLALAIAAFYLALTPWTTLWDRDEPRFAQAASEMEASGQWLVPTFNGSLRADKPILAYWLMGGSLRWFGRRAVAARFWSPLALAAAALATFAVGRRLYGRSGGLWSMAVLATTPLSLVEGTAASADALLLAAVTTALAVFAAWLVPAPDESRPPAAGASRRQLAALAVVLTAALLIKGPVGLAVPILSIGGTLTILAFAHRGSAAHRPGEGWRESGVPEPIVLRRYAAGAAVAALVAVAGFCIWAIPADAATGGALARIGLGSHVVARSLSATGGHGRNALLGLFYYGLVVWGGFLPWTPLLPAAACLLAGGRLGGVRGGALLGGAVVPLLVFFTLVATKLPHYVLPAWPPLSLAVGGLLAAPPRAGWTARERTWLRRGVWLAVPPLALVLGALLLGAALPRLAEIRALPEPLAALAAAPGIAPACAALAAVVALTSGAALGAQWRGRVRLAAGFLVAGSAIAAVVAGAVLAPAVEGLKPVPRLARAVRAATPAGTPVAEWGFNEPSLVFELGRWPVEELGGEPDAAVGLWLRRSGAGVLVLPRQALERARRAAGGALAVRTLAAASGLDVTHGRWIDLVAVERTPEAPPPPPLPRMPP